MKNSPINKFFSKFNFEAVREGIMGSKILRLFQLVNATNKLFKRLKKLAAEATIRKAS